MAQTATRHAGEGVPGKQLKQMKTGENKTCQRIKEFNRPLLGPIVQIKYRYMLESIFRFYRGTCHLFHEDISAAKDFPGSPLAWICGDLHLENFGSYRGDNRMVYFDLNDFDEAVLAPALYDPARLVASIYLAFEVLGIEHKKADNMARLFLRSYSSALANGKPNYIDPRTAQGIICGFLEKASVRGQGDILRKKVLKKGHRRRLSLGHPKHLRLSTSLKKNLLAHVRDWLREDSNSPYNYEPVDAVFRLAGTGSVGQKRYLILLRSLNAEGEKYLLIDMKQARDPSPAAFIKEKQPDWDCNAERIVTVQSIMQNRAPALLSTTVFKGDHYVVQEMQPEKDSIDFRLLRKRYRDMVRVVDDMAMLTASSQLRASGRKGAAVADELVAFGGDTGWHGQLLSYAASYAVTVKQQYADFRAGMAKKFFVKNKRP